MAQIQIRLSELAERLGTAVEGSAEDDPVIDGITTIDQVSATQVTFVAKPKYLQAALESSAAAVILPAETPEVGERPVIRTGNMLEALLATLRVFHPERTYEPGVHGTAVVDSEAKLGEGVSVQPNAVIEAGA